MILFMLLCLVVDGVCLQVQVTDHLGGAYSEVGKINPRLKGFAKSSGCSDNLALLDVIIQTCKRNREPLSVIFIDFTKAFDTVSNNNLWETLEQIGVDDQLRKVIKDSYQGSTTRIRLTGRRHSLLSCARASNRAIPCPPYSLIFPLIPYYGCWSVRAQN